MQSLRILCACDLCTYLMSICEKYKTCIYIYMYVYNAYMCIQYRRIWCGDTSMKVSIMINLHHVQSRHECQCFQMSVSRCAAGLILAQSWARDWRARPSQWRWLPQPWPLDVGLMDFFSLKQQFVSFALFYGYQSLQSCLHGKSSCIVQFSEVRGLLAACLWIQAGSQVQLHSCTAPALSHGSCDCPWGQRPHREGACRCFTGPDWSLWILWTMNLEVFFFEIHVSCMIVIARGVRKFHIPFIPWCRVILGHVGQLSFHKDTCLWSGTCSNTCCTCSSNSCGPRGETFQKHGRNGLQCLVTCQFSMWRTMAGRTDLRTCSSRDADHHQDLFVRLMVKPRANLT